MGQVPLTQSEQRVDTIFRISRHVVPKTPKQLGKRAQAQCESLAGWQRLLVPIASLDAPSTVHTLYHV